jgi:hypothetical protein
MGRRSKWEICIRRSSPPTKGDRNLIFVARGDEASSKRRIDVGADRCTLVGIRVLHDREIPEQSPRHAKQIMASSAESATEARQLALPEKRRPKPIRRQARKARQTFSIEQSNSLSAVAAAGSTATDGAYWSYGCPAPPATPGGTFSSTRSLVCCTARCTTQSGRHRGFRSAPSTRPNYRPKSAACGGEFRPSLARRRLCPSVERLFLGRVSRAEKLS